MENGISQIRSISLVLLEILFILVSYSWRGGGPGVSNTDRSSMDNISLILGIFW